MSVIQGLDDPASNVIVVKIMPVPAFIVAAPEISKPRTTSEPSVTNTGRPASSAAPPDALIIPSTLNWNPEKSILLL